MCSSTMACHRGLPGVSRARAIPHAATIASASSFNRARPRGARSCPHRLLRSRFGVFVEGDTVSVSVSVVFFRCAGGGSPPARSSGPETHQVDNGQGPSPDQGPLGLVFESPPKPLLTEAGEEVSTRMRRTELPASASQRTRSSRLRGAVNTAVHEGVLARQTAMYVRSRRRSASCANRR